MSSRTQLKLIEELIRDVEAGRPIVPLIGAGFSVESGIPTLSGLTEYLAKVQCYIYHSVFSSGAVQQVGEFGPRAYVSDPSSYIGDFGWPDPHRLNAELWTWVDRSCPDHRDYRSLLGHQVQVDFAQDLGRQDAGLGAVIQSVKIRPSFAKLLADLRKSDPERFDGRIQQFFELPGPIFTDRLLASFLKEVPSNSELAARIENARRNPPPFPKLKLQGNWKTLLAYLTNFNPDYVDTLFQSLLQGRQPGTTHRFLAFLTPILHTQLFLTLNFDNLLEQALRLEGLKPVVYEVSRDSPLPHPTLVQKELSVVKLHGGTFGLRVGEELDQPLDENSKKRLEKYLPEGSALLVMGVGGWDRRIRDFVEVVAQRPCSRVYWMHFERDCPSPIREIADRTDAVYPVRTYSTSAFLQELYYSRANSHPPSRHPYTSAIVQPIDSAEYEAEDAVDLPIHIFLNDPQDLSIGGSLRLGRFVTSKAATHVPIWIDLEIMHTVEDVVAEIFQQVRKYDRWLSLTVLPTGPSPDDEDAVGKAVRRIYTALSRGRYILAFNAVESFGRPPTYHHGVFKPLDNDLFWRLFQAAHRPRDGKEGSPRSWGPIRDSLLAFSVTPDHPFYQRVRKSGSRILQLYPSKPLGPEDRIELPKGDGRQDFEDLLLLSAFRRRRSLVALQRLVPHLIEERIQQLEEQGYTKRLESGHYWMCPTMRNSIYKIGQRFTRSQELVEAMKEHELNGKWPEAPLKNLSRLACIHERIAKFYYSELFASSQEVAALLEHLYHSISLLRYLTKLQAWPPSRGQLKGRSLSGLRLDRLRSLRAVLEREAERLLSDVTSDALIGWIDWVRNDDLRRFVVDTCLASAQEAPAVAESGPQVEEIREECRTLDDRLVDLKAYALCDKMDYEGWEFLRRSEIAKICNLNEGSFREDLAQLSGSLQGLGTEQRKRVVRGVCDIWTCLHRNGEVGYSGPSDPDLKAFERFCSSYRENGGDEALWIEFLRCKADYGLIGISPWAERVTSGPGEDIDERCRWTIQACSEALERIDLLTAEEHAWRKSYLHCLKAKAFYLQRNFEAAFPEIDLAQVGVAPDTGTNRAVLALGLLRLAELLMLRSDHILSQRDIPEREPWSLAVTSAQRHLVRAKDTLRKVSEMLAGARQNVALWALLYQLKGRLQIEHLLLQSSEPQRKQREERERRRFIERFTQSLRVALRAIRQGLDVVPPLTGKNEGDSPRSSHLNSLLRIWTELMVCSAYLTRREQRLGIADLWRRWDFWNQAAGIRCFDKASPFFDRLDVRFEPKDYETGAQGREQVLQWIRDCVAASSTSLLAGALSKKDDAWETFLEEKIREIPPSPVPGGPG
ncbi:MAG TPA: hypothetical protein VLQ45_11255 [Thermoanaerobaculia bacterium]|nr:hypothetical protein [Thermoanaerobaculia bacterium]